MVVVNVVPFHNGGSLKDVHASAAIAATKLLVVADLVPADRRAAIKHIDPAAAVCPCCVFIDRIALDKHIAIVDENPAAAVSLVANGARDRVVVDRIPTDRATRASGHIDPAAGARIPGRIAIDVVVLNPESAGAQVDAGATARRAAILDMEPLDLDICIANIDHPARVLPINDRGIHVRIGVGPVSERVPAAQDEVLRDRHDIEAHVRTNPGHLDHVARAGGVHRLLDTGVDRTGTSARETGAAIALICPYIGSVAKRTPQAIIVGRRIARRIALIDAGRREVEAEISPCRVKQTWVLCHVARANTQSSVPISTGVAIVGVIPHVGRASGAIDTAAGNSRIADQNRSGDRWRPIANIDTAALLLGLVVIQDIVLNDRRTTCQVEAAPSLLIGHIGIDQAVLDHRTPRGDIEPTAGTTGGIAIDTAAPQRRAAARNIDARAVRV